MRKYRIFLTVTSLLLASCGGGSDVVQSVLPTTTPYTPSAVVRWNNVALESIRNGTLGPPDVARALAVVHSATFDAWAAYDTQAQPISPNAPAKRPALEHTTANKSVAVSMAAYRALVNLFPLQRARLDNALAAQGLRPDNMALSDGTPSAIGNAAAAAIISDRANDGSNQANNYADTSGYAPVNTPTQLNDINSWQPLTFCSGKTPGFISPHWGTVLPFALTSSSQFPMPGPVRSGDPKFEQQAREVLEINATLTEQQKVRAEYWADGPSSETPSGHWFLFANSAAQFYKYNIDEEAMLFMALGNALLDASIATWGAKRLYDSVRPISVIRELFKGQNIQGWVRDKGTQNMKGEDWLPYQLCTFITPPFPEYPSGHSAFSAAAAEVLKRFTGRDFNPYIQNIAKGSLKTESNMPSLDVTLNWATFTEAANEAGMSRRYGGIHFEDGDLHSRTLGRQVADVVYKKALVHFGR